MAEYINRTKVDYEFMTARGGGDVVTNLYERILDIPTADVVELKPILEEYEELVQTNPTSQQVDEFCIRTMRKILCDYYVEKL